MTEDGVRGAQVAPVTGTGVGSVVQGDEPAARHPVGQQPPRLVLLRAVSVPLRVVGVPVPDQQGVAVCGKGRRVEVVGPLVVFAWSNWRSVEIVDVQGRRRAFPRGVRETAQVQADAAPLGSGVRRGQRGGLQPAEVETLADVYGDVAPLGRPSISPSPCPSEDGSRLEARNLGGAGGLELSLLDGQNVDV